MTSAQDTWPVLLVMIALFLVPPAASLRSCLRQADHARRRGRSLAWLAAGAMVSAAALVGNLGIIALTLASLPDEGVALGRSHVIGGLMSWICFWIWIATLIFLRRRHRRSVY